MSGIPGPSVLPYLLGTVRSIAEDELSARAARIRLVLADNDGVLTDTGVYYSARGEEMKRYSIRDGMGVERLRALGIATGIVTGEVSDNLRMRAAKLGIAHLYLGVKDKRALFDRILDEHGLPPEAVAYIGDDVNDLDIMAAVAARGITAAPANAMPQAIDAAHYICAWRGGNGAFRDFAEALITLRIGRPCP
jgi:3-deoxy-D-manno-octulosonate 8-phosphate phosphatase (KDO 8-P phosphatase)